MAKTPNYDRLCVKCTHHAYPSKGKDTHNCTRIRDVITGRGVTLSCNTARGRNGPCGPEGKLFEVAKVREAAE